MSEEKEKFGPTLTHPTGDYPPMQLRPGRNHPNANSKLHAPPGREDEVGSLECELADGGGGSVVTLSRWVLSDEQRKMIESGAHVRLGVWQHPIPPLAVSLEGPPCEECDREMTWDANLQTFTCAHVDDAGDEGGMGGH